MVNIRRIEIAAAVVEFDDFFESFKSAVVHIGRAQLNIP
jgi:hypothetical protein